MMTSICIAGEGLIKNRSNLPRRLRRRWILSYQENQAQGILHLAIFSSPQNSA